jgi:site-specific recombinase XerD
MLQENISSFIVYCKHYQFSSKSIQAFTYRHLMEFVTSGNASSHVKKVRVRTLHPFFHFLEFHSLFKVNIAQQLPYPKIDKNDPQFLTLDELVCPEMDIFCLLSVFSIDYDDRIIILK